MNEPNTLENNSKSVLKIDSEDSTVDDSNT